MAPRYFLDYFIFTWCLVSGKPPQYALKGQDVSLKTDIPGHPDGILWKHNGNKAVEFNGNEEHVYSPYVNRITLDWVSAELRITGLIFGDSGDYELEIEINKGFHRSLYTLEIIDKVATPSVSCEMSDEGSSNISGKLVCSAEPGKHQSLMKFEWSSHGSVQSGPEILISLGDEQDDEVYSCSVSNPLSRETATFTAKDCYPDKGSSVALIASLVILFVLVILVLGILFWKRKEVAACFAKDDVEKSSPPGTREGSDMKNAQGGETVALLHQATTLPSNQTLRQPQAYDTYAPDEMPPKGSVKRIKAFFEPQMGGQTSPKTLQPENNIDEHEETASPSPDLYNSGIDKSDTEADQLRESSEEEEVQQCDPSESEKATEPVTAGVSDDLSEGPQSHLEPSITPEPPEPEKEADDDEKTQPAPASAETSPASQPHSPLTKSSPNTASEDTAREQDDDKSDHVTGETAEKNVRELDSSESKDSSEDKHSSAVPEQRVSETLSRECDLNTSKEETHTDEDEEQQTVKTFSEGGNETRSVDDHEETDIEPTPSPQPQSPTSTKPDNTDTFRESRDTDGEEERRTRHDSDESEGQSDDIGESEKVENKNKVLKEEKPSNGSHSEDTEGQKKDEVVS